MLSAGRGEKNNNKQNDGKIIVHYLVQVIVNSRRLNNLQNVKRLHKSK